MILICIFLIFYFLVSNWIVPSLKLSFRNSLYILGINLLSVTGVANIFCSLWFTILEIYYFSLSGFFFEPVNSFVSLSLLKDYRELCYLPSHFGSHDLCASTVAVERSTVSWLWSVFFFSLRLLLYTLSVFGVLQF